MNEYPESREDLEDERQKIIDELRLCKKVELRVALIASIFDRKGVDFLLSLVPVLGDVSASTVMAGFLLYQGNKVQLPKTAMTKIVVRQASDSLLGMIPYVGAVIDVFNTSSMKSLAYFEQHTQLKIEEAKKIGVPDARIAQIVQDTEKVRRAMDFLVKNKAVRKGVRTAVEKVFKKKTT